jgi:hypothetical protein
MKSVPIQGLSDGSDHNLNIIEPGIKKNRWRVGTEAAIANVRSCNAAWQMRPVAMQKSDAK